MSATLATIDRPEATTRPGALSRLFNACRDRIAHYFVRRAAIARLREFDDRVLRDIGLVRSQIEAAVDGFITLSNPNEDVTGPCASTREAAPWS
jgi:uncharacterized protein YjiS (DUF1127 family)